jgi:hypothetical protein
MVSPLFALLLVLAWVGWAGRVKLATAAPPTPTLAKLKAAPEGCNLTGLMRFSTRVVPEGRNSSAKPGPLWRLGWAFVALGAADIAVVIGENAVRGRLRSVTIALTGG